MPKRVIEVPRTEKALVDRYGPGQWLYFQPSDPGSLDQATMVARGYSTKPTKGMVDRWYRDEVLGWICVFRYNGKADVPGGTEMLAARILTRWHPGTDRDSKFIEDDDFLLPPV